jgi:hypothetical protein
MSLTTLGGDVIAACVLFFLLIRAEEKQLRRCTWQDHHS